VKVAVIMPVYNGDKHIEDALGSLLRQRADADLDIVVVNDGSTDGTVPIVRRLAGEAKEIRLVEQPNRGIVNARNAGFDVLGPDTGLISFLDADDLSPPGRFKRDVAKFAADPSLEFHYGFINLFRATSAPMDPAPLDRPLQTRGIQLGAMLMTPELQKRVGCFDDDFVQAEDVDYIFRIIEARPRMLLVDDVCVHYRRHPNNISRDLNAVRAGMSRAVVKSHIRRKKTGAPAVPPGFFDGSRMGENPEWY
jgi:glycosyltransferase involved in cell wall biosynthesis